MAKFRSKTRNQERESRNMKRDTIFQISKITGMISGRRDVFLTM